MNAQQLLQEISDYCRQTGLSRNPFSDAARSTMADSKAAAQRRPHHHRHARPHSRLSCRQIPRRADPPSSSAPRAGRYTSGRAGSTTPCGAGHRSGRDRREPAAQLPLLRQSPKVSAVRQHLQREMGSGAPRHRRARAYPSAAAGGAGVRRRRWRRLGAGARDARHARPFSAYAVLCAGSARRSALRTSASRCRKCRIAFSSIRHGSGADQPRLCGCAVACGEVAQRGVEPSVARAAADRKFGAPLRAADHRSRTLFGAKLESRRSPRTGNPVYERPIVLVIYREDIASCSTRSSQNPAAPAPITISSSPRSRIAHGLRSTSRPSA